MFSLEDERRRKINLGGVSVTASQASILERVHAQRVARAENKKRTDSAIRIQAWYRGMREARAVRRELKKLFMYDALSLTALRCLVLIGKDDEVLSTWASSGLANGNCLSRRLITAPLICLCSSGKVFALASGHQKPHWRVLVPKASLLLLQSTAVRPL